MDGDECTYCHSTVHLKMVTNGKFYVMYINMVNFVMCILAELENPMNTAMIF